MATRDIHVYGNILFFLSSPFLLSHSPPSPSSFLSHWVSLLVLITFHRTIPSLQRTLLAISFIFGFVMVGSPVLHLLIQGSVENNCNWSIVVIYGEEVSKQNRTWCDGQDSLCPFFHFLGELGEKRGNGDREDWWLLLCWQLQLRNTVISACFTLLDKVTWGSINIGIISFTDWVKPRDSSACGLAWILASMLISQPLVCNSLGYFWSSYSKS